MNILRQSILGDYEKCCFLGQYKWGEVGSGSRADGEEFTNKYAMTGIIFHEVCELWGNSKLQGDTYTLNTLHQVLQEKFLELDENLFKDSDDMQKFNLSLHEQLDWIYENGLFNVITPLAIEFNFKNLEVFQGLLPFNGTIDRIIGDMSEKRVFLEDYKTGRVYTKKELANNVQATIYSLAFYSIFGFLPDEFVFYFTKHKKIKRIKITPDFIERGTTRVLEIWKRINTGNGVTDGDNSYYCTHFCDCYDVCPKYNRLSTKSWDSIESKR